MAKSRSIPTDLLSDPDFMELESDTQIILLLLVLAADTEYATFGSLALQGEADAAHEWITDPSRNRHHTRMSVAFFRRWLKREQAMREQRHRDAEAQAAPLRATGTTGAAGPVGKIRSAPRPYEEFRLPSLMHLAEEDRHARGERH